MKKMHLFILFTLFCFDVHAQKTSIFIEAESFTNKGGWVVDQ